MLRLGIITCAHGNKSAVARLLKQYEQHHVDAIALCGDLGDDFTEINAVLTAISSTRIPIIAFPGSHEPAKDYDRALRKHKCIIDGITTRRITIKGYDLVILPGSSVNVPHGSFRIAESKRRLRKQHRLFVIKDLARFIHNPARTIVLCHDPPRCSNNGIDVAYSGVVQRTFLIATKQGIAAYGRGEIVPQPVASRLARKGCPIKVAHRNVGIKELRTFLRNKRIPFFACGHIHEAGQRAITAAGKALTQGRWSPSVWYNAAAAVNGNGGILIIDDGKGTYKNIRVKS